MKILSKACLIALLSFGTLAQAQPVTSNSLIDKVENLYSEAELQAKIAVANNAAACVESLCEEHLDFDTRVQQIGSELAGKAYAVYPDLKQEVPAFAFTVAEKSERALASNKLGHIVVFRGLQDMSLSDQALKFLLAREMAHVIAKHHDKNISTKLLISALTAVAFPAVAIVAASQAAAEVSTVTSVVTSAASTATSFVGSEVAIAKLKPNQLLEADRIAFKLMEDEPADLVSLAAELELQTPENGWEKDLLKTQDYLTELKEIQLKQAEADAVKAGLEQKSALQEKDTLYQLQ